MFVYGLCTMNRANCSAQFDDRFFAAGTLVHLKNGRLYSSMRHSGLFIVAVSLLTMGICSKQIACQSSATPLIGYHEPKVDSTGHIVPWFSPQPSIAYDHDIRILWDFWHNMRKCSNEVPYYLQHQVWTPDGDKDDPRGLGGDQINMALDSWNLL